MGQDRTALSAFLRDRRDRLTPASVGLTEYGRRRVPGLRREELAQLAGVSPDYYSKLEQGRQANVSPEVLRALARALRLDAVESAYLYDLAAPSTAPDPVAQAPDPGLLQVMQALDHVPVILLGRAGEILASNALIRAVLSLPMETGASLHHYLFRDPIARERIVNWSQFASAAVAGLRRDAARRPHDPVLAALIEELRVSEPQFAQWWDDHEVLEFERTIKVIQHPSAGTMQFGIEFLCTPGNPDQSLIVYTVEPDSTTARVLPILASWDPDSTISV
ncbi:helix-turn-helix domain-containing protein [Williamsia maris]|uniref:Helix-turn-helix domain-containing protein n=1 Tax=Williamsia maris TaxID=72806 RepID=A0ABT1HBY7_9NOCA|nr:helix-turn-helix transcriptional regulator [Williamsia maris]MCP2175769.1 Helix-turn-helix domain-containing protein [Williamsia maris]